MVVRITSSHSRKESQINKAYYNKESVHTLPTHFVIQSRQKENMISNRQNPELEFDFYIKDNKNDDVSHPPSIPKMNQLDLNFLRPLTDNMKTPRDRK